VLEPRFPSFITTAETKDAIRNRAQATAATTAETAELVGSEFSRQQTADSSGGDNGGSTTSSSSALHNGSDNRIEADKRKDERKSVIKVRPTNSVATVVAEVATAEVAAVMTRGLCGLAAAVILRVDINGEKPQLSASFCPVEVGGGGGGCGHRGKPMGPRNLAAAHGCCERRNKSTSGDAGLRGRRF